MLAEVVAAAGVVAGTWQSEPPLPLPRTEVAGAVVRGEVYVVGGYLADGQSSRRVDVYSPATCAGGAGRRFRDRLRASTSQPRRWAGRSTRSPAGWEASTRTRRSSSR